MWERRSNSGESMPKLPDEIVALFNNPKATKILATLDAEGNVHATPIASLQASADGSMLLFAQVLTKSVPEHLNYMKKAGKTAVAVAQICEPPSFKGFAVRCNVGERITSGPIFDMVSRILREVAGLTTQAVWTLIPVEYKVCTPGPDVGKKVKL